MEEVFEETNTDSTRKLATVQVVDAVNKHPDADALELATVLGWQVVVRLNEVVVGQRVVFCEIDSLLPEHDTVAWIPESLRSRNTRRIKTIKLRGQLSQGLIIPAFSADILDLDKADIGDDVTDALNITKCVTFVRELLFFTSFKRYEAAAAINGAFKQSKAKVNPYPFPQHLVTKTDEDRLQSAPRLLKQLAGKPYAITVKHDGSSGTFLIDPKSGTFLACSRNQWRLKPGTEGAVPSDIYWEVALKLDLERKLRQFHPNYAIQGEVCGPKIQKNLLGLKEVRFYVFNIFDVLLRVHLPFDEMLAVCRKLGLETVFIVEQNSSFGYDSIPALLELSDGFYPNTKQAREGIVVRSFDNSISFKVISNKYILKNDA